MATLISLTVRDGALFFGLGAEDMTDAEFRVREEIYVDRAEVELASEFPGVEVALEYDRRGVARLTHYAETSDGGLSCSEDEHIGDRIRDALGRAFILACEVSL